MNYTLQRATYADIGITMHYCMWLQIGYIPLYRRLPGSLRVAEGYEELHRVIGYKGTGLQGKVKQNIVLYLALCDFDCVTADSSVP